MAIPKLKVRVASVKTEAERINSYELVPIDGNELPLFTAGSHVDLFLPNGINRSYSLLNGQGERNRYVIAVNNDPASRGGSKYVHENIKANDVIDVSEPRNNFKLNEDAAHSVLIAGGIGVTPMLSMGRRLKELGKKWEIHYSARARHSAAFMDELRKLNPSLRVNFDQESGRVLDISTIVRDQPANTHFYCCGPGPMLSSFESALANVAPELVHIEHFAPLQPRADSGGFKVILQKSGKEFEVLPGKTILDALVDHGVDIAYSCSEGVCGTCETKVIEGVPDHRDQYLSKEEKQSNKLIMVCCSGCKSDKLVLDL
jgi:ferredoxin-NADP reductase